jgi:hypothetical protein
VNERSQVKRGPGREHSPLSRAHFPPGSSNVRREITDEFLTASMDKLKLSSDDAPWTSTQQRGMHPASIQYVPQHSETVHCPHFLNILDDSYRKTSVGGDWQILEAMMALQRIPCHWLS